MKNEENPKTKANIVSSKKKEYSQKEALIEFEELKNIALSCYDKNGNPNISAAIRAAENKAKIAGHYTKDNTDSSGTFVKMGEISIDGKFLKFNIGETPEDDN